MDTDTMRGRYCYYESERTEEGREEADGASEKTTITIPHQPRRAGAGTNAGYDGGNICMFTGTMATRECYIPAWL